MKQIFDNDVLLYMVEDESDLAEVPDDCPVGTIAHTAGFQKMWEKAEDGTFVEIGGVSNE